jgi:hypothetical protein
MTTARLGALMTNAGRAADGAQLDPECSCCQDGPDTARHVLLRCQALKGPRDELWGLVIEIWSAAQQSEFAAMTDQQQYMTLLGKQMTNDLDAVQQLHLDSAVKQTLVKMDDIRKDTYELQPMNGNINNRPPEQSILLAHQWREMTDEIDQRRAQEREDDGDDDLSDLESGDEFYNSDEDRPELSATDEEQFS